MYGHSELVLFIRPRTQTAALKFPSINLTKRSVADRTESMVDTDMSCWQNLRRPPHALISIKAWAERQGGCIATYT